jgi:hypothetical protein
LLRTTTGVRITLVLISIREARATESLSAALAARLPEVARQVLTLAS